MKLPKLNCSYSLFAPKKPLKCIKVIFRLLIISALLLIIALQINLVRSPSTQYTRSWNTCNFSFSLNQSETFPEQMRSFPWQQYKDSVEANDICTIQKYSELLLTSILIPFTIKEPNVPVNLSCQASPIWEPERIGPCIRLEVSRKVGVILNFGFDVDALELHLHELNAVADKFFLMEGTKIHNRYLDVKPSVWDMIKYTPRFSQFRKKIVHFVLDDGAYAITENSETILPETWDRENLQKKGRLEKFLKWNSATGYFGPQDIIGIGDADEIPSRNSINFLKSCDIQNENVKIGIWFPFPYIDTIFASLYPVSDDIPFTFSNSEYSMISTFTKSLSSIPAEVEAEEEAYVLGGLHFSKYPYLPFQLIKLLTCTTCGLEGLERIIDIGFIYKSVGNEDVKSLENLAIKTWIAKWDDTANRIKTVDWFRTNYGDDVADMIIKIPWFYQCNPNRFPSFEGTHDVRIA